MSLIARQSARGALLSLIGGCIGFITTFFITTKVLTPEEIGLVRLLVEVATLLSGFALLATNSSAIRYYPHFHVQEPHVPSSENPRNEGEKGLLKLLLIIISVGLSLCTLLYLLLKDPIIHYFAATDGSASLFRHYYYAVLPLMIFLSVQTLMEVYCSLRQRVAAPKLFREVLLRLLHLLLYTTMAIVALRFNTFVTLFVVAYGIIALLCFGYGLHLHPSALSERITPLPTTLKRDFIKYTLFTLASALGGSIISRLDIFMVSSQMGLQFSGIYTIAFFIVAVIEMPSRSISAIYSPLVALAISEQNRDKVEQLYLKVATQQLLTGSIIFLLIWFNIDLLFALIPHGTIYQAGKWVVFFLGIGRLLDLTFNFGNAILRYSKYFVWTLAYTIITTMATILFNLYLIKYLGITGAAIGTLSTYLLSYTFQQIVLRHRAKIELPHGDLPRIFTFVLLLLLVHQGLDYTLHHHYPRLLDDTPWEHLFLATLIKNGTLLILGGYLLTKKLHCFREIWAELRQKKE